MKPYDWKSVAAIEKLSMSLPFPENYYRGEYSDGQDHDGNYILEQLSKLTIMQRQRASEGYSNAYTGLPTRFECNTRLRAFVERCENTNRGVVLAPPMMRER